MTARRWLRLAARIAFALLLLVVLAGVGAWFWLRTSLPPSSGTLALAGLEKPVEVLFDDAGVPTIRAQNERDAAMALGYLHAANRLFQMELNRRVASGRLAEIFGERALPSDRYMRLFGFADLAESDYARLPADPRALFDAYARGVNAWLDGHSGAWPPELYLLGGRPEPWRPQDSLLWSRLMSLLLSTNWPDEWLRARLAQRLSPAQLESLWPVGATSLTAIDPVDPAAAWRAASNDMVPGAEFPGASNSWAVAGALTDSGHPLLANDPHLGLGLPVQWFLVRIETPGSTLVGATAPGVPLLILGQNGHVAWSFTTTVADNQDLFLERLAAGQPDYYLAPEGPRRFTERQETIRVRDGRDVIATVRSTRHGPVISDTGRAAGIADADEVVALGWACLEPGDRTPEALYRMNHASDAATLRQALALFDCPVQNIVYADRDHIGFVAAGRIPIRKGLLAGSQMPVPGWDGMHDWAGVLADGALPQLADPADGVLATANNDIRPQGYSEFVAGRFDAPYRVDRIREAIAALRGRGKIRLEDMAALQTDTLSLAAKTLLPQLLMMLATPTDDPPAVAARKILKAWDFRVGREAAAPLIFNAWLGRLDQALFADELGELFPDYHWWNAETIGRILFGGRAADRMWCDDMGTPAVEDCARAVRKAFEDALADLAGRYGPDPARWHWGEAHEARFAHPLFGRVPLLDRLTGRPLPTDGDNYTLNRAVPALDPAGAEFPDLHGAGFRAVYDLADPERSRFVIAGGQSGNPLSPHYDDLLGRWRDGGSLTIVGDGSGGRLTLEPATLPGDAASP